jgi:hypothetical protein
MAANGEQLSHGTGQWWAPPGPLEEHPALRGARKRGVVVVAVVYITLLLLSAVLASWYYTFIAALYGEGCMSDGSHPGTLTCRHLWLAPYLPWLALLAAMPLSLLPAWLVARRSKRARWALPAAPIGLIVALCATAGIYLLLVTAAVPLLF